MAHFALSLLGAFQATLGGQIIHVFAYDKVRALLAYLVVEAHAAHVRDRLAGLFWPDLPNAAARTNLRQALATLRHAIGDHGAQPPMLLITRDTIQFNRGCDHTLDITAFQTLLTTCATHRHRHVEACTACARRHTAALALYRGDFLADFFLGDSAPFEEWVALTRERIHGQACTALTTLAAYHEHRGAYDEALPYARRLVALEPWNEEAHQHLMRLLWLNGQRSAALVHYQRCCDLLRAELGTELTPETTALFEQIRSSPSGTMAPRRHRAPSARPSLGLPAASTPLVGRETERAQLADLLELRDCRLVTLIGPGGVGKTRLALRVAADVARGFADGVSFVALEAIVDPELVPTTIARALGVSDQSKQSILDRLCDVLRERESLLVLDNFEQLLAAAPTLAGLLRAAPRLTILVTSRAPLQLHAEQVFAVPPLTVPDPQQLPDLPALMEIAAVALFVRRAQAVQPDFRVTPANAPAIAAICVRLDGLPLAIELAATRSASLTPQALLARLNSRLRLLTAGAADLPIRQKTLRATIDWSCRLLTVDQRRFFARLGIFTGGWTLEAAEAICAESDDSVLAVLERLDALVLHQFVWPDGTGRYRMLETLREYAFERLEEAGEVAAVGSRHATYFGDLAVHAEPWLGGLEQDTWLQRLRTEHSNIRAALAWLYQRAETEAALTLVTALWVYWHDYLQEGRTWLDRGLAADGATTATRAKALLCAGWLAWIQGDLPAADTLLERGWVLYSDLGDVDGTARARIYQGFVATLGFYRIERVPQLLAEVLTLRPALVDKRTDGYLVLFAGLAAANAGDGTRSYELYLQALALFRESGHVFGKSMCLTILGTAAIMGHNYTAATAFLREELRQARTMARVLSIQLMVFGLAVTAAAQDRPLRAARLWGVSEAIREHHSLRLPEMIPVMMNAAAAIARAEQAVGPAAFHAAWADGRTISLEQAIAFALEERGDGTA